MYQLRRSWARARRGSERSRADRTAGCGALTLVGDGTHGRHERIQTFRCQACGRTFTARRDTPLYRLKTPAGRVGEVLTALAEGVDLAAATRIFGHRHATITRWLTRAGQHSTRLHHHWLRDLRLPHLQLDEIRTRLRRKADVLWLWVAIDPRTKLIPVLHLSPRTEEAAHTVIHRLCQVLVPGCLPVFTSDGLTLYFYALTAHFGQWMDAGQRRTRQWQVAPDLLYGQVKKVYRRRRLVQVTTVMRCGTRAAMRLALQSLGWTGRLNTAFVERANLTLRCSVAALARRTWATRQQAPQLLAHLEWWRAYYHFCRPHASLRVAVAPLSPAGRERCHPPVRQHTPAMAAGLTSRRWRVVDFLALPLPAELLHVS
jgi:IS1 family transposase